MTYNYKLPPTYPPTVRTVPSKPPRHRKGERFLKGPVPWTWLAMASALGGRALHVGVALWYLAGLRKAAQVRLSPSVLRELSVKRHAAYRALQALESARLIRVERHRGRSPEVTVLEAPPNGVEDVEVPSRGSNKTREIWEDLFLELPEPIEE